MVRGCAVAGCAAWLMFAGACTSVSKDLGTVSLLYRDARYEAASAWLQQLSLEIASMDLRERAKFHYLRGMTAYRLYQYPDAAHELALAASAVAATGDALSDEQRGMLDQTLAEVALSTSYMTSAPSP
ncbi:MAG TPA: hypothetical protein VFG30_06785 [Polyangiales bacterium]|jgi:hypothetical protein|nr:hypothetical protein [Polyangiales bacterium]